MQDSSSLGQIERAIAGDPVALERLLLDYYAPLAEHVSVALPASIRSVVGIDDIIQQVYSQVFRDIGSFESREDSSFLAWLKTIADNRIRDNLRQHRAKKRGGDQRRVIALPNEGSPFVDDLVEEYAATSVTPSREVARREAIQAIQIALADLPKDYRLVVQLRYFDGLSLEETAEAVGKTTGAVRGVLDRAKQKIRESLQSASRYLSR
jgi:RNA polymerase sigma-70 factor (ECF subfamily)